MVDILDTILNNEFWHELLQVLHRWIYIQTKLEDSQLQPPHSSSWPAVAYLLLLQPQLCRHIHRRSHRNIHSCLLSPLPFGQKIFIFWGLWKIFIPSFSCYSFFLFSVDPCYFIFSCYSSLFLYILCKWPLGLLFLQIGPYL